MNCPYCSKEMQKGYILSSYALARWYAEGKKPRVLPQNSGVRLSKSPVSKRQIIESHFCEECKKIVIDISE